MPKPKKFDRNLIVIGAGAAGLVSAYIAATVKAKVSLIEKHKMGGDCLNTGCVPSKALIRSSKLVHQMQNPQAFGIKTSNVEFEFSDIMQRVHSAIKKIEPHDSVERYSKMGVDCISGDAKLISPYEVEVNQQVLSAKNIIIATGARPFIPPIAGIETAPILTSNTLWDLQKLPKRLLVLGGGPIGCELAQSFARLGAEVTLVEMQNQLMGREDQDVAHYIEQKFKAENINVLTQYKATAFTQQEHEHIAVCQSLHNQQEQQIAFDQVLVAVGRRANTEGFGLEDLNIELNQNGTIKTNAYMQSNIKHIYACGDVAGPYQFTHTAAHQAWYCAVNALFGRFKKFKADYSVIPWATFTDPEVARVGLNETEAKAQGIPFEVTRYDINDLDRAIVDSSDYGFVKVLTKPGKDTILGATIVGEHASDLISEYISAMKHGFGLNAILGTIHIYPTLAEANKYAAGNWKKTRSPQTLLRWIERYHRWQL